MAEFPKHTDLGRILITGANGFVGAALCREFLDRGWQVVAGVRRGADLSSLENLDVTYNYGDVTKPETLPEILEGIDTVVHNAGLVKARAVSQLYAVNTAGTVALFEHALALGRAKRFVLISSQSAAGPSDSYSEGPKQESDSDAPITNYGRSKLQAERSLHERRSEMNLQLVRPVGVYGPGDREVLTFFQTLNRGIRPYIGDRSRRIQMIHVSDVACGVASLLERDLPSGETYTLAEARSYSFSELIDEISRAVDRRGLAIPIPGWLLRFVSIFTSYGAKLFGIAPMLTPEKAGELLAVWEVSTEKARSHFDFVAKIPFSEGARETASWYKKQGWL